MTEHSRLRGQRRGLRRGGRRRLTVRFCVAGLVTLTGLGVLGSLTAPAVAADTPPISLAATIPLQGDAFPTSGNVVMMDPGARRLLYWPPYVQEIRAYDLDTFTEVAHAPRTDSPQYAWALDPQRHVMFHFPIDTIYGYDTRTLAQVRTVTMPSQASSAGAGLLWSRRGILFDVRNAAFGHGVVIDAIDPYASTTGAVLWSAFLNGCNQTSTYFGPAALGETHDGGYLYTVCVLPGGGGAVARLALPADPTAPIASGIWNGGVDLYPGLVTGGRSNSQWVPAVDRMVTIVTSNGQAGWSAYVFDAPSGHFVAAPGLFNPPSDGNLRYPTAPVFGIDPASGRLFAQDSAQATQGRDSSGAPCTVVAPNTNSIAIAETGISGTSVLHFPTGDESINGDARFAGYDPVRKNWWMFSMHHPAVSACNPNGNSDAGFLLAWHDNIPSAQAPTAADSDNGTLNVAEQPGVTSFNAGSDASAYGIRYVLGPSGAEGAMTNATVLASGTCDLNAYVAQSSATLSVSPPTPPLPPQYHAFCNADGRTATFAHVDRVSLDSSEARADAVTADTDRETARDLEVGTDFSIPGGYINAVTGFANPGGAEPCPPNPASSSDPNAPPTTCDQQLTPAQPYLAGAALPFVPASCGDNGTAPATSQSAAPLQARGLPATPLSYPGSASTMCSYAQPLAQGHADQVNTTIAGPLGAPVYAMTATADASTTRTTQDGSIATATSTVKGITVGSLLHIDKLVATAKVIAHGRPGTNQPAYDCQVMGVSLSLPHGVTLPAGVPTSIPQASCQDPRVKSLTDSVNAMFAGALHIEFPAPFAASDNPPGGARTVVQRKSPRGYLSEVALSDADQVQNAILTNDTSIEQPGLVVTYYLDNSASRNHLVASFAAVAATARYGIFNLGANDQGGGGFGSSDLGALPDTGAVQGVPSIPATSIPSVPPLLTTGTAQVRKTGLASVPQAIADGIRFLLQHPGLIPAILAVWLLLVSPGYLLSRRRALLSATEEGV